jgi:hypothetical protein
VLLVWENLTDNHRQSGVGDVKMAKKDKIKYWLKTADQDWKVANHLFEKEDYSYALFFGHLTIEKIERLKKWLLQKLQPSI